MFVDKMYLAETYKRILEIFLYVFSCFEVISTHCINNTMVAHVSLYHLHTQSSSDKSYIQWYGLGLQLVYIIYRMHSCFVLYLLLCCDLL